MARHKIEWLYRTEAVGSEGIDGVKTTALVHRARSRSRAAAERYGSEAAMNSVLTMLSAGCKLAELSRPGIDTCGAYFPDLGATRPPDEPLYARPELRVVAR